MKNPLVSTVLTPRVVSYGPREPAWFEGALCASTALRLVTEDEVRDALYFPGSVVPSGAWQHMDKTAFEEMAPEIDPALDRRSVIHFQVPPEERPVVLDNLNHVVCHEKAIIEASPEAVALDDWFNSWIATAFGIHRSVQRLGAIANYPGMHTGTFDPRISGKLVGLHLDSWDGTRLSNRWKSRYRACFNAGPEPRWFLFIPVALDLLAAAIYPAGFDDDAHFDPPASKLLQAGVMRRVAALRLLPGEGYLAPTDTLFHDVSTLWATQSNINVQLLFDPEAFGEFGKETTAALSLQSP